MGILFNSIDDVDISGSPLLLEELISKMDLCLQNIANDTDQICNIFFKMAGNVDGEQFKAAAVNVYALAQFLNTKSDELNSMQGEIVNYINTLQNFNGSQGYATFNPRRSSPLNPPSTTVAVKFTVTEFIAIKNAIDTYCMSSRQRLTALDNDKNNIGNIWHDSQYQNFANFIDGIVSETSNKIKSLEDYSQDLGNRIKALQG